MHSLYSLLFRGCLCHESELHWSEQTPCQKRLRHSICYFSLKCPTGIFLILGYLCLCVRVWFFFLDFEPQFFTRCGLGMQWTKAFLEKDERRVKKKTLCSERLYKDGWYLPFDPLTRMMMFCAFSPLKVSRNIDLVYGGGSIGLMGLVSQAVHDGGRHVIG